MSRKSILRKNQRPINVVNIRHLRRLLSHFFSSTTELLKKVLIVPMKLFATPIFTSLIVVAQMITGAILGANLGVHFTNSNNQSTLTTIDFSIVQDIWNALDPVTQVITISVLTISIIKAALDLINSYYEQSKLKKLYKAQKSLPGRNWLNEYQDALNSIIIPFNNTLRKGLDGEEINTDDIKEKSLDILKNIRNLAAKWDNVEHNNSLSANIMFYINKSNDVKNKLNEHWDKNKVFYDSEDSTIALSNISGVLAVVASSNSKSEKFFERSREHTPLILPVRHSPKTSDSVHLEIPGAPTAFSIGSYDYLSNVNDSIREWVDIDSWQHFSEMKANDLVNHYSNDKTNRSNLSMALHVPENINFDESFQIGSFIGVLNIYSSKKDILSYGYLEFYQFMRPFLETLTKALILQEQILNQDESEGDEQTQPKVTSFQEHKKV